MRLAFSMLEILLVLLILGIIFSVATPKFQGLEQSVCTKKLQLQMLSIKLAIKELKQKNQPIDLNSLLKAEQNTKDCNFTKQNNTLVLNIGDKKAYFVLKNSILECQHTKSAKLHNGESLCDVF